MLLPPRREGLAANLFTLSEARVVIHFVKRLYRSVGFGESLSSDMPTLYLKEQEVAQLATVAETIDVLEEAFRDQASGRAFNNSRSRLRMPTATLHMMAGAVPGYFGYKVYTFAAGKLQFLCFLFAENADLVAMIEANTLGQIRTGAASGLATRILSNPDATEAALFGVGWQAQSQLLALDAVRKLKRVWVVNRNPQRREVFMKTDAAASKGEAGTGNLHRRGCRIQPNRHNYHRYARTGGSG